MTIRALKAGEPETHFADLCIVGGGMAGLLLATRLGPRYRVVVVESGPASGEPFDALNVVEDVGGRYGTARSGRIRALGGTSTVWGGRLLPLTQPEMTGRPEAGLPAWPISWEELDRFTPDAEQLLGVASGAYDGTGLPDPLPRFAGLVERRPKWAAARRLNFARHFAGVLERPEGPLVLTEATAIGFEVDRDAGTLRAVRVRTDNGARTRVEAATFIIAAGAIESTRLLLLFDAAHDGRPFAATDALGRYFQDHVAIVAGDIRPLDPVAFTRIWSYRFSAATRRSIHLEIDPESQSRLGTANAFAHVPIELPEDSLAAQIRIARAALQTGRRGQSLRAAVRAAAGLPTLARMLAWRFGRGRLLLPSSIRPLLSIVVEQRPDRDNRITLSRQLDPFGLPLARIAWTVSDRDALSARIAAESVRAGWSQAGFDAAFPIDWRDGLFDGSLADLASRMASVFHPSGSVRMGDDPRQSVVDRDLRCHGVPNLFVASTATFPVAGAANPSLTLLQLTLRLADRLATRGAG